MVELHFDIDVPDELKEQAEESKQELSKLVKQLVAAKLFEKQLAKSTALQRAVFESLAAKSKLTEEGAKELASEIDEGMLKELKKEFPNL